MAYLSSEVAFRLSRDDKSAMMLRRENIGIAKQKIVEARVNNGNEGWSSSDIGVDWMNFRRGGGSYSNTGAWGNGPGYLFGGLDNLAFTGNDSSF